MKNLWLSDSERSSINPAEETVNIMGYTSEMQRLAPYMNTEADGTPTKQKYAMK
ncbi:MAG: hypothetical protein HY831_03760 [Candidatus Aenigmarchaeota archaeon]|nr:hypothetical protein [Candidatus Aenigmarchaeota archaeon]